MKRRRTALLAGVLALLLTACTGQSLPQGAQPTAQSETAVTFTDGLGRTVTVDSPQRVAACLASYGEIWQLAGGALAGVTGEAWSERDMALEGVENLGANDAPSAELLLAGGYDFVLLSTGKREQAALGEVLEQAGIVCAYFGVETFEEYLAALKICTDITGHPELYERYGLSQRESIRAVCEQAAAKESHPRVLLLRAQSTGVKARGADNMVGAELEALSCVNVAQGTLSESLSLEAILAADPDYILIVCMGSADKAQEALTRQLTSDPAWQTLTAVREGRVCTLDKTLFQYKPNSRWEEAYRVLYELLYGEEE